MKMSSGGQNILPIKNQLFIFLSSSCNYDHGPQHCAQFTLMDHPLYNLENIILINGPQAQVSKWNRQVESRQAHI